MSAFEDFVNLELTRRSALLTKAITSYDANPNLGGAPVILQGAPLGTWFYEETADEWWRKKTSAPGSWAIPAGGGGGGLDIPLVEVIDVPGPTPPSAFTLAFAPSVPTNTQVELQGVGMVYGISRDFDVVGSQLNWHGVSLDVGDVMVVLYYHL